MPKTPQDTMIDIPVVLSKKVDGIIYNLIVRSSTDQVFQNDFSLTEILQNISKSIDARVTKEEYAEVQQHLNTFFADQPEEIQTLRDVHNYIQAANDKIEAANNILSNNRLLVNNFFHLFYKICESTRLTKMIRCCVSELYLTSFVDHCQQLFSDFSKYIIQPFFHI